MITLVNEYSAVLDACVLLPIKLCDLLLRLAEDPALYSPKWSVQILDEVKRNLQSGKFQLPKAKAEYRIACMDSAFPEAMVHGFESLISSMPNHAKDRHVLACAVVSKADCIVTSNLKDFPATDLSSLGIEPIHPNEFLLNQWTLAETVVREKLQAQARAVGPVMSSHLRILEKSVPNFAAAVRPHV